MYVCVHVCSLMATRVLSCLGPEHQKPLSSRPLTYRGAVLGLPEPCCVALGHSHRSRPWTTETTGEATLDLCIDVV